MGEGVKWFCELHQARKSNPPRQRSTHYGKQPDCFNSQNSTRVMTQLAAFPASK